MLLSSHVHLTISRDLYRDNEIMFRIKKLLSADLELGEDIASFYTCNTLKTVKASKIKPKSLEIHFANRLSSLRRHVSPHERTYLLEVVILLVITCLVHFCYHVFRTHTYGAVLSRLPYLFEYDTHHVWKLAVVAHDRSAHRSFRGPLKSLLHCSWSLRRVHNDATGLS